jgi:cytochrome P450
MTELTKVQAAACPFSAAAKNWNPWDKDFISDPWPVLAQIQEEQPVFYKPEIGYWVVTKHADVRKCFLDNKTFTAELAIEPIVPLYDSTIQKFMASGFSDGPVLVNEQPPTHRTHRTRLQRQFEPAKLRELEPFVRSLVNSYIDRFVKLGRADLMKDFIYDIPALVVFKLLGVAEDDLQKVKHWAGPAALFSWGRPTEAEQNEMADALGEYWKFSTDFVEWKKNNLGDDFISDAIRGQMEEGKDEWPDDYLVRLMLNFTFAGHETTTNASGNAVMNLLTMRDRWEALVADPAKIPNAVNECLRVGSSIIAWRRQAVVDTELSGVTIPAGAKLLIYNGAANRDPAVFENPQEFDIERENATRLLSFGFGPHLCLGQPVAKLEMKIMLEELTRRLPHIQLEAQEFTFSPPNTTARGPDEIWATWDPAKNPIPEDRP